jgi:hypothetical protein
MTCVAVIVVPLVVPNTRTASPAAMAPAEVELVPFWYVVDGASSTVTCCPAAVVMVKLDASSVLIVPAAPPAAGPDRALDAPPRDPIPLAVAGAALPAVAEEDLVRPTESPITANVSALTAAITIHRLLLLDSHRRTGRPGRGSGGLVGS